MADDLEAAGTLLPPAGGWWDETGAYATERSGGLVLEFPVEVEVRLVSPERPDLLADTTIHRLTAALEGLA
ncbi:hypothetical protein ACIRSS_26090 [Amycolatopsis sp. NPDC101161]|uniref:hypothetical protein n=1 Tax=Amycolatopsis sp. NPDC101161 TaxID=3363940 RepID=UPI00382FA8D3